MISSPQKSTLNNGENSEMRGHDMREVTDDGIEVTDDMIEVQGDK
jgi:hypothetical protein